jgi:very-short-patch-repair endonuclease
LTDSGKRGRYEPRNPLSPFGGKVRVRGAHLQPLARQLRLEQTNAERKLWANLRSRAFQGVKFRRQHPVGNYTADFCCPDRKLIIELDGGHHASIAGQDLERTASLEDLGYRVLRFWNGDVLARLDSVLQQIELELSDPHPNPLPGRERGRDVHGLLS